MHRSVAGRERLREEALVGLYGVYRVYTAMRYRKRFSIR
jgi:hypothetical protein